MNARDLKRLAVDAEARARAASEVPAGGRPTCHPPSSI